MHKKAMTKDHKVTIRSLMFMILLFHLSISLNAQLKPYAGLEYYMGYNYLYKQRYTVVPYLMDIQLENIKPQGLVGNTIIGLEYQLKNFYIDVRVETLTYHDKGLTFMPIQSNYYVSLSYRVGEVEIKYEHACFHPHKYLDSSYFETFGGYDKIGIYWKLKKR